MSSIVYPSGIVNLTIFIEDSLVNVSINSSKETLLSITYSPCLISIFLPKTLTYSFINGTPLIFPSSDKEFIIL